jgi:hypothetical protein
MSENMERLGNIARGIVNDDGLRDVDWVELSVVFRFQDDGFCSGNFGYAYDEHGRETAFTVDSMEVEKEAESYREWLRQEDDKGFSKMLFQFNRVTRKVNADFEYDDPSRWQVTPKNLDSIVKELRPNLGE